MVYYMVTYDVSSEYDKYRKKVADVLIDYGLMRIQYSVFLGDLGRSEAREIATKINEKLDLKIPIDIRFMRVCKSCLDSSFVITRDIKSSGLVASTMRSAIDRYVSYLTGRERETSISEEGWLEVYPKEGVGDKDGNITWGDERDYKDDGRKSAQNGANPAIPPEDLDADELDELIGIPDLDELKRDVAEFYGCPISELVESPKSNSENTSRDGKEATINNIPNSESTNKPMKKSDRKKDRISNTKNNDEKVEDKPAYVVTDRVAFI